MVDTKGVNIISNASGSCFANTFVFYNCFIFCDHLYYTCLKNKLEMFEQFDYPYNSSVLNTLSLFNSLLF